MRSLAALLLLTSTALAQPAPKAPPVLAVAARITSVVDSEKKLDAAALAPAIEAVRADLDRCAKQAKVRATATLTFEKGAVAIAAPSDAFGACIAPPLKKVAVHGAGKVVVVIELAVVEKVLDEILSRDTKASLERFSGIKGSRPGGTAFGQGTGTGIGDGVGTGTKAVGRGKGTGGSVDGDLVTHGKIGADRHCVGEGCARPRPIEVRVAIGEITGNLGGYTVDDVTRVVKSRGGIWKACYQKELNRTPGLSGKLTFRVAIGDDGLPRTVARTFATLASQPVEDCVKHNLMRLRFPQKDVAAEIIVPMIFNTGS